MANGVVVRNATTGRIMNPVAAAAEGAKIAHH